MFDVDPIPTDPSFVPGARVRLSQRAGDFKVGHILVVDRLDFDGTFIGRDPDTGRETPWVNCRNAEVVHEIGWEFLKTALTPRGRTLLEAFDGHLQLSLKPTIADALVRTVPDLADAIIETHQELETKDAAPQGGSPRTTPKRPPRGRPPSPAPSQAQSSTPRAERSPREVDLDLPALTFERHTEPEPGTSAQPEEAAHG